MVGDALYPRNPRTEYSQELDEFVAFLHALATREPNDTTTPLDFRHVLVRTHVVLVGHLDKISQEGMRPYLQRIQSSYSDGARTVYLCARGELLRDFMSELRRECLKLMCVESVDPARVQRVVRPSDGGTVQAIILAVRLQAD